ncbi:hypothetical protein CCP3SC15_2570004 [Gammaproteobacteria bacterium]
MDILRQPSGNRLSRKSKVIQIIIKQLLPILTDGNHYIMNMDRRYNNKILVNPTQVDRKVIRLTPAALSSPKSFSLAKEDRVPNVNTLP